MSHLHWMIAAILLAAPACNPFEPARGGDGQPCRQDGTCDEGLSCVANRCAPFICPTQPPCDAPGLPDQGPDGDGDGWGRCCDCEDGLVTFYPGAPERCDDLDNDCDGETDEGDACPPVCSDQDGDGFGADCPAGEDCNDFNAEIHPGAEEDCNRVDDDCDGQTDEDIAARDCPLQVGVCAGTQQACDPGQGWLACDYGPDHSFDGDTRCDGLDNDCDGETDEDALVLEPEDGPLAGDGLDNNCNGLVDEPGGVLVPLPGYPGTWVSAYEVTVFDGPDCTGNRYGEVDDDYPLEWPADGAASVDLYACSLPGIVPSGHLSWHRAQRACRAQGMRLCSKLEWGAACTGGQARAFPYGPRFTPTACNDMQAGAGQVEPTGTRPGCTAGTGTWDMSGNLEEWVFDAHVDHPTMRMRGGGGYACVLCNLDEGCWTCGDMPEDDERIRFLSDCLIQDDDNATCPPERAEPWYGTRCCYAPD